jgi:predicted molibdopterin-dependent oxidoreductase YjgC
MEDWKIISEISTKMGVALRYSDAEDIMDEISNVSPLYRDLNYREIGRGKSLWPYHGEPLRGEISEQPPVRYAAADFNADYYLALERPLFHGGTLSRRSPALMKICPGPTLRISVAAAESMGLKDGDEVEFSTPAGSATVSVTRDESIKDNKMLLSNTFPGKGAYSFLKYTLDPVTKAPGTEGCEIKIQKR